MKQKLMLFLFLGSVSICMAQLASPDTYHTKKGNLIIQPIQHTSLMFKWQNKNIYVDPSGIEKYNQNWPKADIVYLTDIHGDHLNTNTLKQIITPKTILVMPLAVQLKLKKEQLPNSVVLLQNGEEKLVLGIKSKAIPMYNLSVGRTMFHTKGRGNGYVLNFSGLRVYISGDTEDIKEMRALKHIDIAFVCMNLPYTMSVEQAASAVLDFKPKVVYPFHYRGKGGFSDVNKFKTLVNKGNKAIYVKLKNWYPKQ